MNDPLRLMMFASCYGRGLTQQLVEQSLAFNALLEDRYLAVADPREQYPGLSQRLSDEGVKALRIDGLDTHAGFSGLCQSVSKIARAFKPSVVIAHTNWQFLIADVVRRSWRESYSLVYVHHGFRNNRLVASLAARTLIGAMLFARADLVVAPSSTLLDAFPSLRRKSVLIPLGADTSFFKPANPARFGQGVNEFVFPGEFRHGKNQDGLIRAFDRYAARTGDASWRLHMPGDGPRLPLCRKLAMRSRFHGNFLFPGPLRRQEILALYDQAQFAVIPSSCETYGHCIAEPFIRGRVVISRPVGVAKDLIRHGENGFLFDTEHQLPTLLRKTIPAHEQCRRMAVQALSERDRFRWDSVCKRIETAIRSRGLHQR